jgi:hypothetical protein
MDRPERFPRTILDICEKDDIDIPVGVVTNHRAHASVVALFLREQDVPSSINCELYPISEHMLPVILHMMEYLGRKEGCCQLRREQSTRFHLPEKPVQIAGSHVGTAIGRPDGCILTHNLGYVLLHSPFAGKTGMDVRGGTERVKR